MDRTNRGGSRENWNRPAKIIQKEEPKKKQKTPHSCVRLTEKTTKVRRGSPKRLGEDWGLNQLVGEAGKVTLTC